MGRCKPQDCFADRERQILRRSQGHPALPHWIVPVIAQLLSFLGVGLLATVLQYAVTAALVLAHLMPLLMASTLGSLGGAVLSYWANARRTFADQSSPVRNRRQQLRFAAMVTLGCALNAAYLKLGLVLGLHPVAAQMMATVGVLAGNFSVSRLWVYRRPRPESP